MVPSLGGWAWIVEERQLNIGLGPEQKAAFLHGCCFGASPSPSTAAVSSLPDEL